jgi:ribosome-associated protein
MTIVVTPTITIPSEDYEVAFSRSGGSGGQNVNKVSSRVQLRFFFARCRAISDDAKDRFAARYASAITKDWEVIITSDRERDQAQNIEDAKSKLAAMIVPILVAPKPRKKTKPSRGANERRLTEKRVRTVTKAGRGRVDGD